MPANIDGPIIPQLRDQKTRVDEALNLLNMPVGDAAQAIVDRYGDIPDFFSLIRQEICIQGLLNPNLAFKAMILDQQIDVIKKP